METTTPLSDEMPKKSSKTGIIAIAVFLLLIGAGAFFFVRSKGSAIDTAGWQTYQNETQKMSIKYPPEYEAKEVNSDDPVGLLVTFSKPASESEETMAILQVASQKLDIEKLLSELKDPKYADANVKISDMVVPEKSAKKISAQSADNQASILYIFNDEERTISLTLQGAQSVEIGAGMISTFAFKK